MKKNISINISGIIFHVEEDGYELLKNYLESISRYFSTYEDSKEITDDIESRIAEIFLSKLNNSKQVITREDVEGVIKTMGSVEDFAAADMLEEEQAYRSSSSYSEEHSFEEEDTYGRKRLYRDNERKVLGGVAAGIAHYFKTDPLWIRLAFLLFLFADAFASFGTVTLVAYIVLWIVLPGSNTLTQNAKIKKLFRNPDDKVIGGVAGGIAAYFGTDPTLLRLLFVLSIFLGGTGFFIYIILWIITPEAKTLTDKMQMKGEPVTLTNIESSIKKNFSVDENGEENLLVKIILFPFRLIATIINALGKAIGPAIGLLGDLARVFAGLILILLGGSILFSLLVGGGVFAGLSSFNPVIDGEIPLQLFRESVPLTAVVFAFITTFIPALALIIAGIAIIARRKLISSAVGWSALGVWFIALIGLSVTVPQLVMDFREEGSYTTTDTLKVREGKAILSMGAYGESEKFARPRLMLRGHSDSTFEVETRYEARGNNRKAAIDYAQMVSYEVSVEDSAIIFPPAFTFDEDAKFRKQQVEVILFIPYQQEFIIDRELSSILRNTLYQYGYNRSDLRDNVFMFTPDGLQCTSCSEREVLDRQFDSTPGTSSSDSSQVFDLSNFETIHISGPFRVNIRQADEYRVEFNTKDNLLNDFRAEVEGNVLELQYGQIFSDKEENMVEVFINLPELQSLRLNGSAKATIDEFEGEKLSIDLSGSSEAYIRGEAESISLQLRGASIARLFGQSAALDAVLSGATRLEAQEMNVNTASLETTGASSAKVNVSETLNADAEDSSQIQYEGEPELNIRGDKDKVKAL